MPEKNKNSRQLTVENKSSNTEKIFLCLASYMQENNISNNIQDDLRLALEETFINIVSYAHPDKQAQNIKINFSHTEKTISITFTDTGKAFNPLKDAKKFDKNDEHIDGGMGIHLIQSLTDEQLYKRTNQTNVFTLIKHYTGLIIK